MPVNTHIALKNWDRFQWCRDNGHADFVKKADRCDAFFRGDQWDMATLAKLNAQRRPALTINKIISTISNVMGEQIYNRAEISFRPRSGAPAMTSEILTKVFKQVSDNNQLDWKRSDMFADGIITSRGFLDMRMAFDDTLTGDIVIESINPKNVIIDPDADKMDPDTWKDLFITKWLTIDDIEHLYSKADADILRNRNGSSMDAGYDSVDFRRDRFGNSESSYNHLYGTQDESNVIRNIRVLERQFRVLSQQEFFVAFETGDMRPVPESFSRDKIAYFKETFGFGVVKKSVPRIKWQVTADDVLLHDKWSPYKHFTIIPYFPYFRHGRTIGLVENLTGPQELLNKVSSQELHVINTTANSGWKMKKSALANMSVAELEQRGAETGLVIEVNGDIADIEKITPNQIPTGLDRVGYKAEESIKSISGISDSQMGQDRADVAAKAIQAKRQAGSTNLAKPLDSLTRTDWLLARNALDLIQEYYGEERIMNITHDKLTGETEEFTINEVNQATGEIINDLTIGEYDVVISSVPVRETLEDSQFEQAVALKELGLSIPDNVLIESSRLNNKSAIVKQMEAAANSPEAQEQAQLQKDAQMAEISKTTAETRAKDADTQLKTAKAGKEEITAQKEAMTPPEDNGMEVKMMESQQMMAIKAQEHEQEMAFAREKFALEMELKEKQGQVAIKAQEEQITNDRIAAVDAANNPEPKPAAQPTKEKA